MANEPVRGGGGCRGWWGWCWQEALGRTWLEAVPSKRELQKREEDFLRRRFVEIICDPCEYSMISRVFMNSSCMDQPKVDWRKPEGSVIYGPFEVELRT